MGRVGPLFAIYLTTTILTALLSNGASVTIVYPIAKAMVSGAAWCCLWDVMRRVMVDAMHQVGARCVAPELRVGLVSRGKLGSPI